ncbi:cathepsin S-like [Erpetoichthys calabaricus]|uniref:cathepsin S-like n=1 Tax=Erpetoichthys calabaricus TaxID=27687 RepID=UPI0010A08A04|nr:cathepsin S-like [Erpetoichthys calabaricus]
MDKKQHIAENANNPFVVPLSGSCGCCWTFSATGAIEGQTFKKTGKLIPLSKQNLLDCSAYLGNQGCSGGRPSLAFQYVIDNGGIQAEATYPYTMAVGSCRFNSSKVVATVADYKYLPIGNEQALADALATIGPISVVIDANQISFQFCLSGELLFVNFQLSEGNNSMKQPCQDRAEHTA